jgi:hypothetical protein
MLADYSPPVHNLSLKPKQTASSSGNVAISKCIQAPPETLATLRNAPVVQLKVPPAQGLSAGEQIQRDEKIVENDLALYALKHIDVTCVEGEKINVTADTAVGNDPLSIHLVVQPAEQTSFAYTPASPVVMTLSEPSPAGFIATKEVDASASDLKITQYNPDTGDSTEFDFQGQGDNSPTASAEATLANQLTQEIVGDLLGMQLPN